MWFQHLLGWVHLLGPWRPGRRTRLTRDTGFESIVTATLASVAFQTRDLLMAMRSDGLAPKLIRVDGGMVNNTWFGSA